MTQGLDELTRHIKACRLCRDAPRFGGPLPHEPNPIFQVSRAARICIAGQAAGTRAHAKSTPFDDPSGDRLRHWLGVDRAAFYDPARLAIIPMGFCFPGLDAKGSDLPPRRECATAWRAALFKELPQIELVLAIGQYGQAYHLGPDRKKTLTATVSDWQRILARPVHPAVLPLPHPSWRNTAWLKKNPWFETDVLPVLKRKTERLMGLE